MTPRPDENVVKLSPPKAGVCSLLALLLSLMAPAWAGEPCIAVYYPKAPEPYSSTFSEIISGIGDSGLWHPEAIAIDDSGGELSLPTTQRCQAQIGLGRVGVNYVATLSEPLPTVFGAIQAPLGASEKAATISLVPDPRQVLQRLRHFVPAIRNVHLLFDAERSDFFVARASQAAEALGLNLITHESSDAENSLNLYRQLLQGLNPGTDAVWMVNGPSAAQINAVLPIILKAAWKRKIVVFSSQATHAKRGVLFSICPDYKALGVALAKQAHRCRTQPQRCQHQTVMPLSAIKTAVNTKTASRLGLALDYEHDPYIDLIFPEKSP